MRYATHVRSALTPFIIAGSAAFAVGCGSKDDNGGTGPTPAIAIALNPTSATIPQGGSAPVTVTVTRSGGFTGDVSFAVTGNPTGVTGAISDVQTASGVTTATVTVQVAASVAVGTYNLTLTGSGTGITAKSATFALTVSAAPAYTLTLSSAAISVAKGSNNTATVTLNRTNFTGAVTLSLVGAPTNVTGVFDPAAPTGTTSTLTVSVGASVDAGTYNLTVHGEGPGATVAGQDTPLTLTVTTPVVGNFTIDVVPTAASVVQGVNPASAEIGIQRTGGFTGTVTFTVTGAPTGVTTTVTPDNNVSSTLAITVAANTVPGVYPLTIHGNATGLAEQTATYTLTVTAAPVGDFTLSLTPSSASVNQGVNPAAATININRTGGFTGSVALTVTGAPAGVTASATPSSTTTNSSTLNITVAGSTAVGVYPLVVHGNATGVAEQTVTYTLTVTAPASGSITLNFAPCLSPIWVAVQDNNGPWTPLTLTNGSVTANINGPKVGLAYVTGSTAAAQINIIYLATSDISGNTQNFCGTAAAPGTNTMNGTATGFAANDFAFISMGGGSAFAPPSPFTIPNVASGTQDLFGYRRNQVSTAASPDKLIVRRDIAVTNGGSVGAQLDFDGVEAVSPASANITVVGAVAGGPMTSAMSYRSGAACYQSTFYVAQETGTTFPVFGVPSGLQRSAEGHSLLLSSLDPADATNQETYIDFFHTMAAHTITFGGLLPVPTVTSPAGPYKRLQAAFTLPAAYNLLTGFSYVDASNSHIVSMNATSAYLGGTSVTLTMPDFSGLTGWDNGYAPASASTGITTTVGTGGSATFFLGCSSDGFLKAASRQGTY